MASVRAPILDLFSPSLSVVSPLLSPLACHSLPPPPPCRPVFSVSWLPAHTPSPLLPASASGLCLSAAPCLLCSISALSLSPPSPSAFLPAEENHDNHLLCGAGGGLGVIHWGDAGLVGPPTLSLPDLSPTTSGAIPPPPLHSIPCSRLTLNTGSPP
mgnify:CR=1 FL=1